MAIQSIQPTRTPEGTDAILARLDAIMRELQTLRQAILVSQPQPAGSIVDQLWGAMGQGTAEELATFKDHYLSGAVGRRQEQIVTVQVQDKGHAKPLICLDDIENDSIPAFEAD